MSDDFNNQNKQDQDNQNGYVNYNNYSQPQSNPYEKVNPTNNYQSQNQNQYQYYNQPYGNQQNPQQEQNGSYSYGGQPPYTQPVPIPVEPAKGISITGFIFSLLGILCCCSFMPFSVTGMILSLVAMSKGNKKGLTITALVLGIIGTVFSLIAVIMYFTGSPQMMEIYNEILNEM